MLPYIVPAGGFMVTPVIDIDVGTVYEIGDKLVEVVKLTMAELRWKAIQKEPQEIECSESITENAAFANCHTYSHTTKSCTSCSNFVCRDVRTRFLQL